MINTTPKSPHPACLLATAICAEGATQTPQAPGVPGVPQARSNVRAMEAIAAAILNRADLERTRGMGATCFKRVCTETIASAPNGPGLENSPLFPIATRIAKRALAGALADPTDGATRFHPRSSFPDWAQGRTPTAEFGEHVYYREGA